MADSGDRSSGSDLSNRDSHRQGSRRRGHLARASATRVELRSLGHARLVVTLGEHEPPPGGSRDLRERPGDRTWFSCSYRQGGRRGIGGQVSWVVSYSWIAASRTSARASSAGSRSCSTGGSSVGTVALAMRGEVVGWSGLSPLRHLRVRGRVGRTDLKSGARGPGRPDRSMQQCPSDTRSPTPFRSRAAR